MLPVAACVYAVPVGAGEDVVEGDEAVEVDGVASVDVGAAVDCAECGVAVSVRRVVFAAAWVAAVVALHLWAEWPT